MLQQPPEWILDQGNLTPIFLAGPIQGAPDWQALAIEKLNAPQHLVLSPRRDYEADGLEFVYERQVDWETEGLRLAADRGLILFWLAAQLEETPGRAYAQTSRFELGEWVSRASERPVRLAIGIEEGFGNERYIRRRLGQDLPGLEIQTSLEATCRAAWDTLAS